MVGYGWTDGMLAFESGIKLISSTYYKFENGTVQTCYIYGIYAEYNKYLANVDDLYSGMNDYYSTAISPNIAVRSATITANVTGPNLTINTGNLKTADIAIYDIRGKKLKELHNGMINNIMNFDIKDLSSQMMILKIRSDKGDFNKMISK